MKSKVSMLSAVRSALSVLDSQYHFKVVKTKGVRSIRVYFDSSFCKGTLIQVLFSISGCLVVGINCEYRCILLVY